MYPLGPIYKVDLHPTVAALAGIPFTAPTAVPAAITGQILGKDVTALFDTPSGALKQAVFMQWPSCGHVDKQV
jgi:hypothetical protein